jgi:hypothetical protein
MKRQIFVLLLSLAAGTGCAKLGAPAGAVAPGAPGAAKASETNRFLAYEHSIDIKTDEDKIVPAFDAVQAACRAATEDACAILEARVSRGETASASLRFRAKSAGIRKLIAVLASQGEVASQSTTAEDLAGPIADNTKQLAMLTDYRGRLEALRGRPSNDLDALMKLTRELADVQSQIETLTGSQAHLMQRVETELLNVSINSYHTRTSWAPIADAGSDFRGVLAQGVAGVIIAIAFLLPWAVVAGLIVWAVLAIRRWRKRRRAGTGN